MASATSPFHEQTNLTPTRRGPQRINMCCHCRHQRKKCVWDLTMQECQLCVKLHRQCGGPDALSPTSKSGSSPAATQFKACEGGPSINSQTHTSKLHEQSRTADTYASIVSSGRMADCEHEVEALPVFMAARVLFKRYIRDLGIFHARLCQHHGPFSPSVKDEVERYATMIMRMIQELKEKEEQLSDQSLRHQYASRSAQQPYSIWRLQSADTIAREREYDQIISCTANILDACTPPTGSSYPNWESYLTTELVVKNFLVRKFGHESLPVSLHRGFPAHIIAYLNQDSQAVRQILRAFPPRKHETDIIRRKVAHVLVENDDWPLLEHIACQLTTPFEPQLVPSAELDGRGLSLLAIAGLTGKADNFELLWGVWDHTPPNDVDRDLFPLALLGGNLRILQRLVTYPSAPVLAQPWTKEVKMAIELVRSDLARCFLYQENQAPQFGDDERTQLADLARKYSAPDNDMEQLSKELMTCNPYGYNPQAILASIDRAEGHMQEQATINHGTRSPAWQVGNGRSWAQVAVVEPAQTGLVYTNQSAIVFPDLREPSETSSGRQRGQIRSNRPGRRS